MSERIDPLGRAEENPMSPTEFDAAAIRQFDQQGAVLSAQADVYLYAFENPEAWSLIRTQDGEERYRELRRLIAEEFTVPLVQASTDTTPEGGR